MINTNIYQRLSIALFEPRIPQNTGNIARTCAAFKLPLHLIGPLGFKLDDKYLKRAGLDYWPFMNIKVHNNFQAFYDSLLMDTRIIGFSKRSQNKLDNVQFLNGDVLMFGREDIGIPAEYKGKCSHIASIPMPGGVTDDSKSGVRSLNLASATAIAAYQASLKLGLFQ